MTSTRRLPLLPSWLLVIGLIGGISHASEDISGPIVVNVNTGLALSGFDPVAYFTDGKAVIGRSQLELSFEGVVWRFSNEGNRFAFAAHPNIYAPRFGGYDPVAIARGRSVAGNPVIWSIVEGQLYFFYSDNARATFLADPGRILEVAIRKWSTVAITLPQ